MNHLIKPDSRGRVSLAKFTDAMPGQHYEVTEDHGTIILTPVELVPVYKPDVPDSNIQCPAQRHIGFARVQCVRELNHQGAHRVNYGSGDQVNWS